MLYFASTERFEKVLNICLYFCRASYKNLITWVVLLIDIFPYNLSKYLTLKVLTSSTEVICDMPHWSITLFSVEQHCVPLCFWQASLAHLLSNGLGSLWQSSDADLCQSNAGSCILDESLVCIYPLSTPLPSNPLPPLSLSSFFLRRHFNMYANGLRSTGRYVWSPVLQSGGVGEIVFVFMRHGPRRSWEKTLWVVLWWRLCSADRMQICQ